jgi:hypothetical protein
LEQADKAYERKKSKRPRKQGRNPLLRRTVHTSSVGTQTELHAPEETTEIPTTKEAQNEEVIPLETHEIEAQTEILVAEETTSQ